MLRSTRTHARRRAEARLPRPGAAKLPTLFAVLAMLIALGVPQSALAEWDVKRFVNLRDEAQSLYDKASYNDALPRYLMLRSMIETALEAGEIPEAQVALAQEALEVVRYQIGRCNQLLGACDEAHEEFASLRDATSSNEVIAKLHARFPEVLLCQARAAANSGDLAKAIGLLNHGVRALDEPIASSEGISEESLVMIAQVAKDTRLGVEAVRDELFAKLMASAAVAVSRSDCDEASKKEVLASTIAEARHADGVKDLREAIEGSCTQKKEEVVIAPPPDPVPEERPLPVAAMAITATGGALLVGDLVYELAYVSPTVDDYEKARDTCAATGTSCKKALGLEDDLGTSKIVTFTLVGVGAAALIGGGTWWLLEAFGTDETSAETVGFVLPTSDGVQAGLTWTW